MYLLRLIALLLLAFLTPTTDNTRGRFFGDERMITTVVAAQWAVIARELGMDGPGEVSVQYKATFVRRRDRTIAVELHRRFTDPIFNLNYAYRPRIDRPIILPDKALPPYTPRVPGQKLTTAQFLREVADEAMVSVHCVRI